MYPAPILAKLLHILVRFSRKFLSIVHGNDETYPETAKTPPHISLKLLACWLFFTIFKSFSFTVTSAEET
jgi:hypothetical protein